MNKVLLSIATVALAGSTMAQSPQLSFGADIGLPLGDFGDVASLIIGPSVGFELPVGDNLGVTAQVGYDFVSIKSDFKDFFDKYSMIPFQAGLKYYFTEQQMGAYGHAQIGIHSSSVTTPEIDLGIVKVPSETSTSTNMSWAIGAGYMMEKLDIGLRYNSISPDSDVDGATASSYIGLRVAYLLPLGN
ncbi:MAG: outer membrane beta-barrel protein [Flavobacteriales bacterium]|nr:outer membrane beta-barrel protein [Flavobacteriales bacterium]